MLLNAGSRGASVCSANISIAMAAAYVNEDLAQHRSSTETAIANIQITKKLLFLDKGAMVKAF